MADQALNLPFNARLRIPHTSQTSRPPHMTAPRAYCSVKNQGFLSPYLSPGTCIGTGTILSTFFESLSRMAGISPRSPRAGISTPHSQLRQLSLGSLVARSLTSLPHALSEQFAEPTYAQDLNGSSLDRTNSSLWIQPMHKMISRAFERYLVMHKHTRPYTLAVP